MAVLALVCVFGWIAIVAGVRSYLHLRRTGEIGHAFRDRRGSAQWWSRLISSLGVLFAVVAPLAELAGLAPFAFLAQTPIRVAGLLLVVLGIVGTVGAQSAMGASWRADVDPEARTALVTTGPYRLVRNPILTATATTAIGLALIVPNVLAVAMLAAFVLAMQIQVRLVEEPHLERVHGAAYRDYAARVGRFLPLVGRLRRA